LWPFLREEGRAEKNDTVATSSQPSINLAPGLFGTAVRTVRARLKNPVCKAGASGDLRIVEISRFENRRETAIFFTLLPSKYLLPPFFFWNQAV
jgi:hypothetical protein